MYCSPFQDVIIQHEPVPSPTGLTEAVIHDVTSSGTTGAPEPSDPSPVGSPEILSQEELDRRGSVFDASRIIEEVTAAGLKAAAEFMAASESSTRVEEQTISTEKQEETLCVTQSTETPVPSALQESDQSQESVEVMTPPEQVSQPPTDKSKESGSVETSPETAAPVLPPEETSPLPSDNASPDPVIPSNDIILSESNSAPLESNISKEQEVEKEVICEEVKSDGAELISPVVQENTENSTESPKDNENTTCENVPEVTPEESATKNVTESSSETIVSQEVSMSSNEPSSVTEEIKVSSESTSATDYPPVDNSEPVVQTVQEVPMESSSSENDITTPQSTLAAIPDESQLSSVVTEAADCLPSQEEMSPDTTPSDEGNVEEAQQPLSSEEIKNELKGADVKDSVAPGDTSPLPSEIASSDQTKEDTGKGGEAAQNSMITGPETIQEKSEAGNEGEVDQKEQMTTTSPSESESLSQNAVVIQEEIDASSSSPPAVPSLNSSEAVCVVSGEA